MAKKVTKKKQAATEREDNAKPEGRKAGRAAKSKFEEFDVSDALQKESESQQAPEPSEANLGENASMEAVPIADVVAATVGDSEPVPVPTDAGAAAEEGPADPTAPALPIPQLIPPESPIEVPIDDELVPLPTLQVVPMMNRASEAQCGLLKEPLPPPTIRRVTQPGVPAPAMPTALMELLCS